MRSKFYSLAAEGIRERRAATLFHMFLAFAPVAAAARDSLAVRAYRGALASAMLEMRSEIGKA